MSGESNVSDIPSEWRRELRQSSAVDVVPNPQISQVLIVERPRHLSLYSESTAIQFGARVHAVDSGATFDFPVSIGELIGSPVWSPDGSALAFLEGASKEPGIMIVGGWPAQMLVHSAFGLGLPNGWNVEPTLFWRRNGTAILFVASSGNGLRQLREVDLRTGATRVHCAVREVVGVLESLQGDALIVEVTAIRSGRVVRGRLLVQPQDDPALNQPLKRHTVVCDSTPTRIVWSDSQSRRTLWSSRTDRVGSAEAVWRSHHDILGVLPVEGRPAVVVTTQAKDNCVSATLVRFEDTRACVVGSPHQAVRGVLAVAGGRVLSWADSCEDEVFVVEGNGEALAAWSFSAAAPKRRWRLDLEAGETVRAVSATGRVLSHHCSHDASPSFRVRSPLSSTAPVVVHRRRVISPVATMSDIVDAGGNLFGLVWSLADGRATVNDNGGVIIWVSADSEDRVLRPRPRSLNMAITGGSPLWFLRRGYLVVTDVVVPIVRRELGGPFGVQVAVALQKVVTRLGASRTVEPSKIVLGGDSFGACAVAAALTQTDEFAAAILRSGCYNRTLAPFGMPLSRGSYWEVPDEYRDASPFELANRISTPSLLIHGEADPGPATLPLQSQAFHEALRAHGTQSRLVLLPGQKHETTGLEATERVVAEMLAWGDRWTS